MLCRYPDLALSLASVTPQKISIKEISHDPDEETSALYIYGLARPSQALLSWLEAEPRRHLIFLEDQTTVLAAFQEEVFLSHPQIDLKWTLSSKAWDPLLEECAAQFPFEKIEVICSKTTSEFPKIKESLLRRTLLWHSVTSEEISGHLLHRNLITNLGRISSSFYVNKTKDIYKQTPVIICGAGPSLEMIAQDLRNSQYRALILGCGSALSALSHLGIRPDFGMAVDPNPREFDCLKGCQYSDLPLLFTGRLYPKVFELFKGPSGYIRCGSGGPLENYLETELGLKGDFLGQDLGREALSVTTLALSLAYFWGCNPIILAGVDLAFSNQRHYASGVLAEALPLTSSWRRQSISGKFVRTTLPWMMERDTLDTYAKNHPETAFFTTSSIGLKFSHIRHQSLQQILNNAPIKNINFGWPKIEVTPQQISLLFSQIKTSLERCRSLLLQLEQEESGSGKAILYESDLELELAYSLLLHAPRLSFERLKGQGACKFLIEVCRSYLEIVQND